METEPDPILIPGHSACKSPNKITLLLLMIPVSNSTQLTLFCSASTHPSHDKKIRSCKKPCFDAILRKQPCPPHKATSAAVLGMQVSARPASGLPLWYVNHRMSSSRQQLPPLIPSCVPLHQAFTIVESVVRKQIHLSAKKSQYLGGLILVSAGFTARWSVVHWLLIFYWFSSCLLNCWFKCRVDGWGTYCSFISPEYKQMLFGAGDFTQRFVKSLVPHSCSSKQRCITWYLDFFDVTMRACCLDYITWGHCIASFTRMQEAEQKGSISFQSQQSCNRPAFHQANSSMLTKFFQM